MSGGHEAKRLGFGEVAVEIDMLTERVRHPLLEGFQRVGDESTCLRLSDTPEVVWKKYRTAIDYLETKLNAEDRFILSELLTGAIYDAQTRAIQIADMSATAGLPDWGELYGIPNPEPIK
jgi:hypothetical protein